MVRVPVTIVAILLLAGCTVGPRDEPMPYYEAVISGDPFTDLVVEIDHAPGHAPSRLATEHLLQELRNVTAKTRISIRTDETLQNDPNEVWTAEELISLEIAQRDTAHIAPIAVLHVLYPAGSFERGDVAGVTISGPVIGPVVVFLDTIDEFDLGFGPIPQPQQARDEIERSTLLHEAGHAMGLVDNGLPMVSPHEDAQNEGHSNNEASVMFWQVESINGIRQAILSDASIPFYFDAADRADMRAVGGR